MNHFRTKLMPYDVYERHHVVSQLLEDALGQTQHARILDVGGRVELLEQFLPYDIVSVNPDGTGHLFASGTALPFASSSFDAVVSIDTLEHLPPNLRLPLLQECVRVCKQVVIIAAPFGSAEHIAHEKELDAYYRVVNGRSHQYLSEHIQHGLPTETDLNRFAQALQPTVSNFYYAGDFIWQGETFKRAIKARQQPIWQSKITNLYNRFSSMALFHSIDLANKANTQTNRFYLLITKNT